MHFLHSPCLENCFKWRLRAAFNNNNEDTHRNSQVQTHYVGHVKR